MQGEYVLSHHANINFNECIVLFSKSFANVLFVNGNANADEIHRRDADDTTNIMSKIYISNTSKIHIRLFYTEKNTIKFIFLDFIVHKTAGNFF